MPPWPFFMTQMLRAVVLAGLFSSAAGIAYSQQPGQKPAAPPAAPAPQTTPAAPPATPPAVVAVPPIPAAPTTPAARTFAAGCGILLQPVRPERTADFERFLDYVRDALARTPNTRVRSQVPGWRFFKAAEPGPSGVALYVFWVDPAIPGAEYSLGAILSEVYTDPAQLTEIWTLYQAAATTGGTILNLAPVPLNPPQPILAPPVNPVPGAKPGAPAPAAPAPVPAPPAPAAGKPLPNVVVKC